MTHSPLNIGHRTRNASPFIAVIATLACASKPTAPKPQHQSSAGDPTEPMTRESAILEVLGNATLRNQPTSSPITSYTLSVPKAFRVLFAKDTIWIEGGERVRVFGFDGSEFILGTIPRCGRYNAELLQVAADGTTSLWTCGDTEETALFAKLTATSATESSRFERPHRTEQLVMSPDAKAWISLSQLGIFFATIGQEEHRVLRAEGTTTTMQLLPCGEGILVSGRGLYAPNAEPSSDSEGMALVDSGGTVRWVSQMDTHGITCTTNSTGILVRYSSQMYHCDMQTGTCANHYRTLVGLNAIAGRRDGYWAIRFDDEEEKLFIVALDAQLEVVAEGPSPGADFCGVSPSGNLVAICTDETVHILNLATPAAPK